MEESFHKRFNIDIELDDAKNRLVNRVHNEIFNSLLGKLTQRFGFVVRENVEREICSALGIRHTPREKHISEHVGNDFFKNLHAIETIYLNRYTNLEIEHIVPKIMEQSEVDLGIRWQDGKFRPAG